MDIDALYQQEKEIKRQLHEVQQSIQEAEAAEQRVYEALIVKNIDALLELFPDHAYSSCSDQNTNNTQRGCNRCNLLETQSCTMVIRPFKVRLDFTS
jgi:hypothetical protein